MNTPGASNERFSPELYNRLLLMAMRRTHDRATAEDILHDALEKALHKIGSLKDEDSLQAWLAAILRNTGVDFQRKRRNFEEVGELEDHRENEAEATNKELLGTCLRGLIADMRTQDQQALQDVDLDGLSQLDFASRYGLEPSGARSRVQRARQRLKQRFLGCCSFQLDKGGLPTNAAEHCEPVDTRGCDPEN